ncbi:MFS transporter [Edaphocola flava]|uniref:MFS transporter n=1 Tax=Edaphocola flava TaxID=2499629 RepID=UPI0013866DC7|nr:MFS transporter [Edaphocola flava]
MSSKRHINKRQIGESLLLGIAQILLWGGSYFLLAILGDAIIKDTGWSHQYIYGCLSLALLLSGLISPRIGKLIQHSRRNFLLPVSGLIMGLGLIILALTTNQILFLGGWLVLGFAMGMGLYDALFASLGRKYGMRSRAAIVQITLISGFTTTVVWPLLSFLLAHYGWRGAALIYAVILIVLIFPIHYFSFFKDRNVAPQPDEKQPEQTLVMAQQLSPARSRSAYLLLLCNFTLGSFIMTGIYVYLIDILTHKGIGLTHAIFIGTLIGPSQVGVRLLDIFFPAKTPVKTGIISAIAILTGLILLATSPAIAFLGIIIYSMGNGVRSILRGTMPMWIFGPKDYGTIIGKLALAPLVAQAATPLIGGIIIQYYDSGMLLYVLCVLALINISFLVMLQKLVQGRRLKTVLKLYRISRNVRTRMPRLSSGYKVFAPARKRSRTSKQD